MRAVPLTWVTAPRRARFLADIHDEDHERRVFHPQQIEIFVRILFQDRRGEGPKALTFLHHRIDDLLVFGGPRVRENVRLPSARGPNSDRP